MRGQQKGVIEIEQGALYELPGGWVSNPSAFICAYPRLIFARNRQEALAV
ncbi:MAG: hypothetical protein C5S38_01580 [Candidatus Methanophagaceae archaeon]|jgi:hypothetical protein|nr:MAG: hypothetical protein C5S38_01580 [Methanophagales archaeon]